MSSEMESPNSHKLLCNDDMISLREEYIQYFQFIGQAPSEDVINKCIELGEHYKLCPEKIVEQWHIFSLTELKEAPVNLEGIELMERKGLLYNVNDLPVFPETESEPESMIFTEDHMSSLTISSPSVKSHDHVKDESIVDENSSFEENSSVSSITDETDYTQTSYSDRTDSGNIKVTYGKPIQYSRHSQEIVPVKLHFEEEWYTEKKYKYLYTTCSQKALYFDFMMEKLAHRIIKKNFLDQPLSFSNLTTDGNIFGRIGANNMNKLNSQNVVLESARKPNNGKVITVDINQTNGYSLFPGQVVTINGTNIGSSFIANKFYDDASTDFIEELQNWPENLQVIVAAGPYTLCTNLSYEPLQDLLKYVVEHKPHVLILMGPFVDESHIQIDDITDSYDSYLESLIDNIMGCLKDLPTQVILISSYKDINHHLVYPTPVYNIKRKYPNLICAPDPCMLNIDGLIIGGTTIDILFDLTKEEISRKCKSNRLVRLASHLINQRSFYPLYPTKASIDHELLLHYCMMDVIPHILILPSVLHRFIKVTNGCVVINPERLTKNYIGGTFAVINVSPRNIPGSMENNIYCEIRKI